MRFISSLVQRLGQSTPARSACRAQLRAARQEDRDQYLALAAYYLDLAQIVFGTTASEPPESREQRSASVFAEMWRALHQTERLSDFEYLLARVIRGHIPERAPLASPYPLVVKLRLLDPDTRFAFIAYELEKWPLRWVALVLRKRPLALHRLFAEVRCELCGIGWDSLGEAERDCLEAISVSLDRNPDLRANRILSSRLAQHPRAATVRAKWLELRPELVEVRHRYLPDQEARERILGTLYTAIRETPITRPKLREKMANTLHLSRRDRAKVS